MLKSLTAKLKTLVRAEPKRSCVAPTAPGRSRPSAWFFEMRTRIAARDASVADELRAAAERDPANGEAHALQGELALDAREPGAAVKALERALDLSPGLAEAYEALGRAFTALGRREEAIASFENAIGRAHDLVAAHVNLGCLYEALGRVEDAADCFHLALAFDSSAIDAELGIGRLMRSAGHPRDSVAHLRRVIERAPCHAPAFFDLARSLNQAGDTAGAIGAYEQAIALRPGYAEAYANLGLIHLSQLGDASRAEALFRRAVATDPDLVEAQSNLGLALQEQGRIDEALRHYATQIARWPAVIEFRWNRGIAHLAAGDYEHGWDDFELRKLRPDAGGVHQKFRLPEWDGGPLAGRAILVYGEQGLGDEIMYASCLPEVIAQAQLCVVECDARLAALYRRSFPGARIEARGTERARDWRAAHPALSLQAAVGSLPRYLRRRAADFPERRGYLRADRDAAASWRARLDRLGSRVKIGISWRGGTGKTRASLRSVALGEFDPLLGRPDVVPVILQHDLSETERALLARRPAVYVPEVPRDTDEIAALMCALDLVVTVDNTNVHLGGALGCPVWALLPASPEWRYGPGPETMPWYPSVNTFRRGREEGWGAVLSRVAAKLDAWLPQARSAAEPR